MVFAGADVTGGESVEQIQPDLIIPTGKRKGQNPSVASIYRALAKHAKHEAYPEAVEQAHADFAALQDGEVPGPRAEPETFELTSAVPEHRRPISAETLRKRLGVGAARSRALVSIIRRGQAAPLPLHAVHNTD
ncbi:hypothetical protein [Streptomyces canus]|uniref:hypothetical protein n=1 Tax=Streptomyces canus TaxID=58343 RepID=UPI002E285E25|nr:hypothetical protein [Streptomyces canus]